MHRSRISLHVGKPCRNHGHCLLNPGPQEGVCGLHVAVVRGKELCLDTQTGTRLS